MNKLLAFLILLFLSPIIGAIYGILHDQITYTLANEYYTKFKFFQFGLAYEGQSVSNPRFLVSIVGIMATWWMGLIIGLILSLVGLSLKNGKSMLRNVTKAIGVTIIIAFATGLVGYFYGLTLNPNQFSSSLLQKVINKDDFIAVGSMHNFSYLGGLIGLIGGIIFIIKRRHEEKISKQNQ